MSEWVSIDERLPAIDQYVLVARSRCVHVGVYTSSYEGNPLHWETDGEGFAIVDVTHWMPLPAPPEQEPTQ